MDRTLEEHPDGRFFVEELARSGQGLALLLKEDPKARSILKGYINYLLGEKPRSYAALADYLGWWGKNFLLPDILSLVRDVVARGALYETIIELGPGTGWLIKEMAPFAPTRFAIDKRWNIVERHSSFDFRVQDLEVSPGFLPSFATPTAHLVVANQFLHCVNNPGDIIRMNRCEWLVVEVASLTWRDQMREFGATPLTYGQVENLFRMNNYRLISSRRSTVVFITIWRPE